MTFKDIDEFKEAGFVGFKKMSDLFSDNSMLPDVGGVYFVLNERPVVFLTTGSGGYFNGKNPNVSIEELSDNWVDKTKVVYIGKATSLKARLRQYIRFGQGKNIGHYGGRYIWQLKYSCDLVVCWKTVINEEPGVVESSFIKLFTSVYSKRPFANLKD